MADNSSIDLQFIIQQLFVIGKELIMIHKIFNISAIFLITVVFINCSSTKDIDQIDPSDYDVRIYEVFGMDCPGCHGGIEKLMNKHSDIDYSRADWEKQQITIYVIKDSQIEDDTIFKIIEEANFTLGKRLQ